jgi:hypothetical protein
MNRQEILKEIEEISFDCSVKDWDGYDGEPIDQKAINYIKELVNKLSDKDLRLAEPSPFPDTRMGIEWDNEKGVLLIGIDKDGHLCCTAIINKKTKGFEYNFAKEGVKSELLELIREFHATL